MQSKQASLLGFLFAGATLALSSVSDAHPVTVDGNAAEWSTRLPNAANLGLIARDAQGAGEYIWRDALSDTRTDISTPEFVADIAAFQVTGDATGIGFLMRRASGVVLVGPALQVQIAIDTDRVDGSGQEFFAEFADTKVANGARWEYLVETLFGTGGTAKVIDTNFNEVAMVAAAQNGTGTIEIFVPWSALGLMGPPTTPLRFTVATFRCQNNSDLTIDIGGPMFSNALDAITDYGDPAAATYPNTYQEVQDLVVDDSFDLSFDSAGEVISPLLIERFLSNSSGGGSGEWITVHNVSGATFSLDGFKIGDEETPDGTEGMLGFPAANLPAGASFTIAADGAAYEAYFGSAPDAELPPGASMAVPDMTPFVEWTGGVTTAMQLDDPGDEILLLDPTNTIVDIAVFGAGLYPGVASFSPAPGTDDVLSRDAMLSDTDDCAVDFSNLGKTCTSDTQCGGDCFACVNNACAPKPMGAACPDADPCNGDEICDGNGACVTSPGPACDDNNPCTDDTCSPGTGCAHAPLADGTSCTDNDTCNGVEVCMMGMCEPGIPLDCDDMDPCTEDTCDPTMGCASAPAPVGAPCDDGDACNGAETCDAAGLCVAGPPIDCDDLNPCTNDTCDTVDGCIYTDAPDGTSCSDDDACNGSELCTAGQCGPGAPLDCDDQNECTADSCDPVAGCMTSNQPQGAPCDDGNACTQTDACDGVGQCVATDGGCGGQGGAGGSQGGAGGMGAAGGTTTTTTTTGGGGDGGQGGATIDDSGCACRTPNREPRGSTAWLSVLALVAILARRRRK